MSLPHRSVLFCPASNRRAMEKALTLPADAVVFDLEDAVAPGEKEAARAQAAEFLNAIPTQQRCVRINGLDTRWGEDDLHMVAASRADAIVLPKVEAADAVKQARKLLAILSHERTIPLWCMIETPLGVLNAKKIARADGVAALVAGANDLSKALRIPHTPGRPALQMALQTIVLAARAYGRQALDSVYNDFKDTDGLERECAQGRTLGFDGKTLIHPSQIDAANRAFAPTEAEIAQAHAVIGAWKDGGVASLNGKMIERLHVDDAEGTLALHEAIVARMPS